MTRVTSAVTDERGFTLAELLIATAVVGLVLAGVFVLQQQGQAAYLLGSNRLETQQNARVVLDLMTRELRSARSVTALASATDITFVNQDGVSIRYNLSGSTLNRTAGAASIAALIGGVNTFAMTYYSVYDVQNGTYTTTNLADSVKVITIAITTGTEESVAASSPGDQHAVMKSTVMLRLALS